jgi:hypothetical protein
MNKTKLINELKQLHAHHVAASEIAIRLVRKIETEDVSTSSLRKGKEKLSANKKADYRSLIFKNTFR